MSGELAASEEAAASTTRKVSERSLAEKRSEPEVCYDDAVGTGTPLLALDDVYPIHENEADQDLSPLKGSSSRPIPIRRYGYSKNSPGGIKSSTHAVAQSLPCPTAPIIGSMPTPSSIKVPVFTLPPVEESDRPVKTPYTRFVERNTKLNMAASAPSKRSEILHHVSFSRANSRKRRSTGAGVHGISKISQSFTYGSGLSNRPRGWNQSIISDIDEVPDTPERDSCVSSESRRSDDSDCNIGQRKVLSFMEESFLEEQIHIQQKNFGLLHTHDSFEEEFTEDFGDEDAHVDESDEGLDDEEEAQFVMEGDSPSPSVDMEAKQVSPPMFYRR
mmetsp:Transcript_5742/g.6619  ORF Transcript_5742/g.6619 Transcript_5742/m.6619 type:complete len:331 (-) Transcript_5742:873-1865(-)|eukprot:CAMPEP_0184018358 /NCGR_PEP_ID=MMETSP0954-20121128/8103_1 /TAXON_ID=627963 /ORGANISM="Aplanochytrium sp, Strain PBS07" /LENGTH=330 /DNA_ID=CAMNT_0026299807 /DNA_START=282 /DNA_END=1274 /DNA_ORIENTATION=+